LKGTSLDQLLILGEGDSLVCLYFWLEKIFCLLEDDFNDEVVKDEGLTESA